MRKVAISIFFISNCLWGYGQFAPGVGQAGTTAIYKDSSAFVAWASGCTVKRGYQDISNQSLGYATVGDSSMALGKAGSNGVVSLGDGGEAILTFDRPIKNGSGWDFAVFENAFNDSFLELAFVEVSSDGINYFRFESTSNTQSTTQIDNAGALDPTQINNLAGKYRAQYGTPFDLQELAGAGGLDVNNITHIKIIDVVGSIDNAYAQYDHVGNKINDPWTTPFPSGGFDLDAVGVINEGTNGIKNYPSNIFAVSIYPNPLTQMSVLNYYLDTSSSVTIEVSDLTGKEISCLFNGIARQGWQGVELNRLKLNSGIYFIHLLTPSSSLTQKIIVQND